MTSDEYNRALAELGLMQIEVARLLDVKPRTSRRWSSGDVPVPRPVALVLRMMIKYNLPADYLWRQMLTGAERKAQERA
jgi:hypothetical protein